MSADWARVVEVFDAAQALPAGERDAFLARACTGDAALESEVRSLLAHHDASAGFLDSPGSPLAAPGPEAAAPGAGAVLGAWRLVAPVGEGGMGTVWLAERVEGEFRQRGALKLIRVGMAFEEAIRRFRRERQILASLEHPNIARLLDGGSTPEGLPWLVMEYVEGEPLYAWCVAKQLALEARLRLFLVLCSAVEYAHQRLVVHRDLKPGNVLVTADGSPRLLDFGIAKIFDEAQEPGAALHTVALPFTPLYASPEQVRGEETTTASDVYSLGVLLYELVTGAHPYPTRSGAPADVMRAVLETEPRRPSTAVTLVRRDAGPAGAAPLPGAPLADAVALHRRLAGDLDNIVLRALAKDPARRYASVERLADDVRRHLEGRPVAARGDAWSYRAGKFVRRNRLAAAAGAVAVLALVGGLVVSLRETAAARHERALAEQRLRSVQSIANTLMFDVYDGIENLPGATAVREAVIAKAAGYLDALGAEAGRDSSVRFSLADAYLRLGIAQRDVGAGGANGDSASTASYERGRALLAGLLAEYPGDAHALLGLIQFESRLAANDEIMGRFPPAVARMRRALAYNERLVRDHPEVAAYAATLPKRHNNVGNALSYARRWDEAAVELRAAADGFAALAARDTADWQQRRLLAMSLTVYGDCLVNGAHPERADSVERRALALYDRFWRQRPDDLDLELRVADAHERLAQIAAFVGHEPDTALAHVALAQALIDAVAAGDPANRDHGIDAAAGRAAQGALLARFGRVREADAVLHDAERRLAPYVREDSSDARLHANAIPNLRFGQAAVALARARTSRAPSAWRAARDALGRARSARAAGGDGEAKPVLDGDGRWIEAAIAACDSALGHPAAHVAHR